MKISRENLSLIRLLKLVFSFALSFALISCDAQVQKNNFRTAASVAPITPTPSIVESRTADPVSISPDPSSTQNQNSENPSPSTSPSLSSSATPTFLPLPTFTPSPSPSSTQASSPSPSPSSSSPPSSIDSQAPSPGDNGQIYTSNVSSTSLDLEWTVGGDNKTSFRQLQYLVYHSTSNNLSTVASTEANGTAIGTYIPDLSGKAVIDLSPGTTYYFNVIVKDADGNKALYTAISASTTDTSPPNPGNSGTITSSSVTATSLSISWTTATDGITASSQLQYLVYRSNLNNLSTVSDIEINGTAIGSYTADLSTKSLTGLISSHIYYFNVLVKDAVGNKAAYLTHTVSTLDIAAPSVGNSGIITASAITPSGMTLSWAKGGDNVSASNALQYMVYQSLTNNIPSTFGAELNGTAIGAYTTDINSKVVTGLAPNTTYYFIVIIRDEAGNKAVYTMMSAATIPLPPTLSSNTEAYSEISTAWTYPILASNGSPPLVFSLTTAPSGATIDASTGVISYSPGATPTDLSFNVHVADAIGRTADQSFTLHVQTQKYCVWTGAGDTTFSTAGNWNFCAGAAPASQDFIIIDASASRQPTLTASTIIMGVGAATTGAGGTLTINPGVDLDLANTRISSDIVIKGATTTCTTCTFNAVSPTTIFITDGATLRLGSGIKLNLPGVHLSAGDSYGRYGHLVVDTGSSNPAEWPTIDCDMNGGNGVCGDLGVQGGSAQNPSSIYIDGLNFVASKKLSTVIINDYSIIKRFRNVNFSVTNLNAFAATFGYIGFYSCIGTAVEDTTWSGLAFLQGTRSYVASNRLTPSAIATANSNCSGISPITLSGSGRAYGLEYDPYNIFNWVNITSATCTWTGAVDSNWSTPGNWNNCTNGRSNYPDQLDAVIIPVAAANQPIVTGNHAMLGTASGSGGGTITVNANSSLYINDTLTDTFSSSVKFAGGSSGCSTCLVQARGNLKLGDGITLSLLPNIRVTMSPWTAVVVGESYLRTNRSANLIVSGGAVPANYPQIMIDPGLVQTIGWKGIIVDGKSGTNSTVSIDGLVLSNLIDTQPTPGLGYGYGTGLILLDRFTVTKLDHLSVASGANTNTIGSVIHIDNCSNSTLPTTFNDLTITSDPSPGYSIFMSDASCSSISPITITGQGVGYGSSLANDPNGRFTWQ